MTSLVRRSLVLATLAALLLGVLGASAPTAIAAQPTSTRVAGIDVDASTIPQLQSLMNRHRLTSVELVQFYLHRIQRLNPRLHAVIVVSPTALADARRADALRRGGDHRPLLGIPIIVKDNIDTLGLQAAAGTEPDGSVVCPSGANGIVGIKPTVGLVSRSGIVPITADQDTSGPMARNVTDAAVLLGAMTGIDPTDPATAGQAGHAFTNY